MEEFPQQNSHLEKRLYFNEIMTGDVATYASNGPVLSYITLSILADSGFYQANLSAATDFSYGRGLGCTFLKSKM